MFVNTGAAFSVFFVIRQIIMSFFCQSHLCNFLWHMHIFPSSVKCFSDSENTTSPFPAPLSCFSGAASAFIYEQNTMPRNYSITLPYILPVLPPSTGMEMPFT